MRNSSPFHTTKLLWPRRLTTMKLGSMRSKQSPPGQQIAWHNCRAMAPLCLIALRSSNILPMWRARLVSPSNTSQFSIAGPFADRRDRYPRQRHISISYHELRDHIPADGDRRCKWQVARQARPAVFDCPRGWWNHNAVDSYLLLSSFCKSTQDLGFDSCQLLLALSHDQESGNVFFYFNFYVC